jgi:hypothetical protein
MSRLHRVEAKPRGKGLFAHTIAAFAAVRAVSSPEAISGRRMNEQALLFQLRRTALDYWIRNGWLERSAEGVRLTEYGLRKVRDRLAGRVGAQSVDGFMVREALVLILSGARCGAEGEEAVSVRESALSTRASGPGGPIWGCSRLGETA